MTHGFALVLAVLAAAATVPAAAGVDSGGEYPNEEAVRRYAQGLLLEARGERRQAQAEYFRALLLDGRAPALLRRISSISAALSEPRRSLEFAERALAVDSADARSWWLKGAALANLGEPQPALLALGRAVGLDSTQADYYRALAGVAELVDDLPALEQASRRLVWLDDEDGEAWFQLAGATARLGRLVEAESLLARAAALNPLRPGIHLFAARLHEALGRWSEAVRAYRRHLELAGDDRAARRQLIEALVRGGDRATAYREARALAHESPQDAGAGQLEVELAFAAAGTAEGLRALDRFLAARPHDLRAEMFAVSVLAQNGRQSQAIRRAERLTRRQPGEAQAWVIAARAHWLSGHTDPAAERLRRAVALAPDSLGPRAMLARLYQEARRYPEAVAAWEEAQKGHPEVNYVAFELATCRELAGDLPGAEVAVRDVLRREPDNATALNFLGYLFADHNMNLQESVELIRRALEREPDNGAFVDSLGWVYYRLGRLEEARRELERAVLLTRGDPVVHEHLGDVYKDLSRYDLARDHYERSLQADTGNARVRDKLQSLR